MGMHLTYTHDGVTGEGYLALPATESGPAVIIIQEWWGLVGHITDVVDRFAAAGFVAFAPDLYHGQAGSSGEPKFKQLVTASGLAPVVAMLRHDSKRANFAPL